MLEKKGRDARGKKKKNTKLYGNNTKATLYEKNPNTHGPQDFMDLPLNCTNSNTVASDLEILQ